MTEPTPQPQAKPRKRFKVEPPPGGQLEQFLIANKQAYDHKTEADEAEAETKKAIKAFLLSLFDGQEENLPDAFDIAADPHGRYPGYTMTLKGGSRVDSEAMRADGIYDRYLKPTTPSWDLREASTGTRRRR